MTTTTLDDSLVLRALTRDDLDAVVAIDAALEGRSRRTYIERRLSAALREPKLHAQFAASTSAGLVGYILARVLEGEFGRSEPALRLEMIGAQADARGHGVGQRLFDALAQWAVRHGIGELRTAAGWRDATMLRWLAAMGFELEAAQVIDRGVGELADPAGYDAALSLAPGQEIDFGMPEANDFERLARARAEIRAMTPADLREIVRIDRGITGRDRSAYMQGRLAEAMDDSTIRVSLAARLDGALVGYLMARADLGDFGRTAAVAVLDTIGVEPGYAHRGVGHALLRQLLANLAALQIERVETVVACTDLALLGFFHSVGFAPSQRLAFVRRLPTQP